MSYARWGWDGSHVYVFDSARRGLECCACLLNEPETWQEGDPLFSESFITQDVDEMIDHLNKHKLAGHTVPDKIEPAIRADFPDGRWHDFDFREARDDSADQ